MACRSACISRAAMVRKLPSWRSPLSWRRRNRGSIACRPCSRKGERALRAVFVDADDTLAAISEKLRREGDLPVAINRDRVTPDQLPALLGDAEIAIIDHTRLPTLIGAQCRGLKHVVFLGTGARSYMNPEELAGRGITVHIIKGYGDT